MSNQKASELNNSLPAMIDRLNACVIIYLEASRKGKASANARWL